LKSRLDIDAMLAAEKDHRKRAELAQIEQISTGQWEPGRWPDGQWNANVLRAYAHAEHGDLDAVKSEISGWHWHRGGGSIAEHILAFAKRRADEQNE
jgi:hypothetical protein